MDISELKIRMGQNVLGIAEHLFPNGKRMGNEYCVGNTNGDAGKSLKIHIGGVRNAYWSDFETGERGRHLFDLWMLTRGLSSVSETCEEIKDYLGVKDPAYETVRKRYSRPQKPRCTAPKNSVRTYLNGRGISDGTIGTYKIGECGENIIFPFIRNSELVMYKIRPARDGAKPVPGEKDMEPCLFGWQAVPDDAREVVITEGEIDACSIYEASGYPALSVPFGGGGGGKQNWIDTEYHGLDRFERIYLCLDQDEPGAAAEDAILSRLGSHRCFRVRLPYKDANDALREGCEIGRFIKEATLKEPEELVPAGSFREQVKASFLPDQIQEGYLLPWSKTQTRFAARPGEVTIWAGKTNHGKSQIISHVMVYAIKQGAKACIASMEMHPKHYLHRAMRQISGCFRPTDGYMDRIFDEFLADQLWCFNVMGGARLDAMVDSFIYARKRYGCDVFVVDSLMRLGVRNDDYAAQADAICRLVDFAVGYDAHVHLVCHQRKSVEGTGTDSIRGAGELADNAANVFLVWRDKKLEEEMETASEEEQKELEARPSVVLRLEKQRNGDWDGKMGLWFDRDCYRYHEFRETVYGYLD
jgi:twinkle protein